MKKLSFLALAAVGLLFGACSDKDVVVEEVTPAIDAMGEGYVGFSIQLPTDASNSTRANDDFNNGKDDEFLVKKAKLILFKGAYNPNAQDFNPVTAANAAKFFKAYDFDGLYENDTQGADAEPTTKITSTAVAVAKIDKFTLASGEKLFAYVVINPNGSELTSPSTDETFEHFSQRPIAASTIGGTVNGEINGTDGLLMTNSPISDTQGGNRNPTVDPDDASKTVTPFVTTAVVLNEENIKTTKAEAKNAPAGCIYVERAAAKVTIADGISANDHNISMGSETVSFQIDGWQVINTEPSYYNTRQCLDAWLPYLSDKVTATPDTRFRFVTKTAFAPTKPSSTGHTTAFRTYFAKDLQYDADATNMVNPQADINGTWNTLTGRAFIPENTFDVEHQTWKNTTQVTLRVKFNGGTGFYTLSDDAAKYTKTNAENKLQNNISALYDVRTWILSACQDISSNKASNAAVTATLTVTIATNATEASGNTPASPETAGAKSFTVGVSFSDGSTTWGVSDISNATIKSKWDTDNNNIKGIAEASQSVTYYADGYAYYNVRIQHFGEHETPWSSADAGALTGTETTYTVKHIYGYPDALGANPTSEETTAYATAIEQANKRYLGRYGIVRDNWYQLSIDGISKLGSAEPVSVTDKTDPDDIIEDEYYISAHVHILPWVIRTQSVNL